ncbi:MAG: endo alpha-1,4 polygalactosaminidase [Chloroflexi bacterium]|nr:endo alpha-1,4 polygalactosaminidase [Chloroflexota bacterium]
MNRFIPLLAIGLLLGMACTSPDITDEAAGTTSVPLQTPVSAPSSSSSRDIWLPTSSLTWQWQLTVPPIDTSLNVDVYDLDLFETDAGLVSSLHAQGRRVICYLSAGSWEDWRPDADQFPPEVIGRNYVGWEGEKWLDIRQIDKLAPILRSRLDQCAAKGFDGVEPDNIDGFGADTGFPLTYADQLAFNRWLADEAHTRGLSIGLKNDSEQAENLLPFFDWALTEDCFAQEWCEEMTPFIAAGKAVFAAEYTDEWTVAQFLNQVCPQAGDLGLSVILKNRDLDAWRQACQ